MSGEGRSREKTAERPAGWGAGPGRQHAAGRDVERSRGPARAERIRKTALATLPTLIVAVGAEIGGQLGLFWRDLAWPLVAFLLFGTSVIAGLGFGKVAGITSAVVAVVYSTIDLSFPSAAPLPIDALELRRYLIYPAVLVPVAWLVGWQQDRIRRAWREESELRREAEAARDEARDSARREAFLAEAARALNASLDVDRTLRTLAGLTVPDLADACIIDIEEDGRPRRVAHTAADPERDRILERLGRAPVAMRERTGRYAVLREGRPVMLPEHASETLAADTDDPEMAKLLRALKLRSVIVLPLVGHARVHGVIAFGSVIRGFDESDVTFADTVATRAAAAIDNARLHRKAVEAIRAKDDFLTVMSHELRTPLTAVVGYADLLEMGLAGPVTDEQREKLRDIRMNAQTLVELIDEVLTFTQLEASRERIRPEQTDVADVVREVAERHADDAAAKGLELRVDVPDAGVVTETDPEKLRQILAELVSNAIRFTRSGSVTVRVRREADDVVIEVADTGIGMAQETIDRIFEPFWQAEAGLTRQYGGTGLGLTIAQRLTGALDGDIEVESEPGKGSTFTVRIPAT